MKSRRTAFSDGTAAQVSNLIMLSGIKIFDVRERGDGCVFSVNSKDFGAAKKVLESKSKSFVPLGNDKGGLLKRVVKRVGVWVGLIIFTAVAVAFSQCVTKISVSGNEEVTTEEIEEAVLKELELPSIKSVVDAERIKQNVCDIEMISDASVEIEGNTVFVNVLERLPQVKTPEGDVKSLYDALITKIVLYEGECKTRVGDTVRAGDVLITKTDGNALGDVYGRVWIHEQTVVPFSRIVLSRTGRKQTVVFTGDKAPKYRGEFRLYETETEDVLLRLAVPFKAKKITYYEVEEREETIDFEARKEEIIQEKFDAMEKTLPQPYEKLKNWFFIKTVDKMNVLDLYYEIEIKISE